MSSCWCHKLSCRFLSFSPSQFLTLFFLLEILGLILVRNSKLTSSWVPWLLEFLSSWDSWLIFFGSLDIAAYPSPRHCTMTPHVTLSWHCVSCHAINHLSAEKPIDGSKNPSQQRETLSIPQVPIRLMNIGIAGSTGLWTRYLSKCLVIVCFKAQKT